MDLDTVTISNNTAAVYAAGIFNRGTITNIKTSTFNNNVSNHGGPIFNSISSGVINNIQDTYLFANDADADNNIGLGGGINNEGQIDNVINVYIGVDQNGNTFGNKASSGGGINNSGIITTMKDIVIAHNTASQFGGGIYNIGTIDAINNTTINSNMAQDGGGIFSDSASTTALDIQNSTVSSNIANSNGGGIYFRNQNPAVLKHVTVAFNSADADQDGTGSGGGIYSANSNLSLVNSILSDNQDFSGVALDCTIFASMGGNLISQVLGCAGTTVADLTNVNANLGPLQNNGGVGFTHALLNGSPALDQAIAGSSLGFDQVGTVRPQGAGYDIGAFEAVIHGNPVT